MPFDHDEINPLDSSYLADFPLNERNHRTAVRDSVDVDHYAETTGRHKQVAMVPLAGDPSTVALNGFLYTKTISAVTELFYMDDGGQVIQLTSNGSASPDKLPIAGGTMTGPLVMDDTTIDLKNLLSKIRGRDVGDANWRSLLFVDASDVCEVGDNALDGGLRLRSDGIDAAVVNYPAGGDKKLWHAGHFANPPIFMQVWNSTLQTYATGPTDGDRSGTVVHGLGSEPDGWMAFLECIDADLGYAVGDKVPIGGSSGLGGSRAISVGISADGTTFFWSNSALGIEICDKSGSGPNNVTVAKWNIRFRAWY